MIVCVHVCGGIQTNKKSLHKLMENGDLHKAARPIPSELHTRTRTCVFLFFNVQ
jgi:hypothetical protein